MRAFHRAPYADGVVEVGNDDVRACFGERSRGGRKRFARNGAHAKALLRRRDRSSQSAALSASGTEDRDHRFGHVEFLV